MSHTHNLSVNSINSIIEPTTPPKSGLPPSSHSHSKSALWDSSNRLNHHLNLPNFNIELGPKFDSKDSHPTVTTVINTPNPVSKGGSSNTSTSRGSSSGVSLSDKENISTASTPPPSKPKIDKEYLASINKLPLSQLKSEILKLSKDQYGCRFLQKKIDENLVTNYQTRLANFDIIFKQIHPYLYELIIDPFGNYLIQKLINYCNEDNLNLILEILQFNLFQISINQHGTRALQKIIDNLNNSHQLGLLIKGLKPYIIELIKDLNGNHVIQKILNKYQPKDCQFIYDSIIDDLYVVATHKHGCCVLQKCLNHVTVTQLQEFSQCILNFKNFSLLINDQFGNYVLQYLISINSLEINYKIFENFVKYGINNLCNLKFSSNVIEKFLKNCYNNEVRNINFSNLKFELIYNVLISELNKLINDPYGNYVIQTLVDILVHPSVKYLEDTNELGGSPVLLASKLSLLIPPNYTQLHSESLQIVIIKYWFQNCKIVSSFGKRIQSKINIILNNVQPQTHYGKKSRSISIDRGQSHYGGELQQNMNSNGEFTMNDLSQQNYRSHSVSSTPSNIDQNNFQANHSHQNSRNLSLPSNIFNSNSGMPVNNYVFGSQSDSASSSSLNLNQSNNGAPLVFVNNNDFLVNEHPFGFPQNLKGNQQPFNINQYALQGVQMDNHYKHQHQMSYSGSSSSGEFNSYGGASYQNQGHKQHNSVSSIPQISQPQPLNYGNPGLGGNMTNGTPPPFQQPNYYPAQNPNQVFSGAPIPQKQIFNQPQPQYQTQNHNFQQQPQQFQNPQQLQYPQHLGNGNFRGNGMNHGHNLSVSSTSSSLQNSGSLSDGLMFTAPVNGNPPMTVSGNFYQK